MSQYGVREFQPLQPADVPLPPVIPPDSESSEDQSWGDPGEYQRQDECGLDQYPPYPLLSPSQFPSTQFLTTEFPTNQFPPDQFPPDQYLVHHVPYEASPTTERQPQRKRQRFEAPPLFDKPPPFPQQLTASQPSSKPAFGASRQPAAAMQKPAQAQRPPLTLEEVNAKANDALRLYLKSNVVNALIVKQLVTLSSYSEMIDHVLQITNHNARSNGAKALLVCARWHLDRCRADEAQLMSVLFALLCRVPHGAGLKIDDVRRVLALPWRLPLELSYVGDILRGLWQESSNANHYEIAKIVHAFCATSPATVGVIHPPGRSAQTPSRMVQQHHFSLYSPSAPTNALVHGIDLPHRGPMHDSQHPMVWSNTLTNNNGLVIRGAIPVSGEENIDAALVSALGELKLSWRPQECRDALVKQRSYKAMFQYIYGLDHQGQAEAADALIACCLALQKAGEDKLTNLVVLLFLANDRLPKKHKLTKVEWEGLLPPTWPLPAEFEDLRTSLRELWKPTSRKPNRREIAELVHQRFGDHPDPD